ncbi:hypothetical protein [Archangium sp.]|uniref:hypothetical protein n=1 Tax=Archangium sp. TaxID=1872627 RepID=UPI002D63A958|nr:hypothetical protein [Archangium sp.]HYO51702.1 hypothetical protein [Archangium sp.]
MGDTPSWSGGRLGPYLVGRRSWESDAELGRLHEAHNVETGAFAVVLEPGRVETWRSDTAWTVRATSGVSPQFFAVEVELAPDAEAPAFHELPLTFDLLKGVLGSLPTRDRAKVYAHLTRKPRGAWPRRLLARWPWLLAGAGIAVTAGLALTLWPRPPEPAETKWSPEMAEAAFDEPIVFANKQDTLPQVIGYPMPDGPFKEQQKPPCLKGTEVEIRGGCWVTLEARPPCPRSTAEFEGKCYIPVRKKDPPPSSLQP